MKKALGIGIKVVVTLIVAGLIWQFVLTKYITLFQSYEGIVQNGFKLTNPHAVLSQDAHTSKSDLENYYWRVRLDSGEIRDIKMPPQLWNSASSGSRIEKKIGKRYPTVVSQEYMPPPSDADAPVTQEPPETTEAPEESPAAEAPAE